MFKKGQDECKIASFLDSYFKIATMAYKHLNQDERYHISFMMQNNFSQFDIAKKLKRHISTIYREVNRGSGLRGYRPNQAQNKAIERALNTRNAYCIDNSVWSDVVDKLVIEHSPEQIANFLPVSHESIYRFIYKDKYKGGDLHTYLRCQKKRKKRYGSGRNRRGKIPNRCGIENRSAHVENKSQIGHWEVDTIIGANHQQALISIVERKTGLLRLKKVANKTSELVADEIINMLSELGTKVKTLTYDNGLEFAEHERVNKALRTSSYFADPYSSWQRGSNENTNGLVRQYIPKKRSLLTVSDEEVKMIEERINNRPRKRLDFKTPASVFYKRKIEFALRV